MKKITLSFLLLLVSIFQLHAQATDRWKSKHNNIWTFGYGYGLDFSTGSPVSFISNISGERCAATACDENGQLLFYTNGDTVWNKNGQIMQGSLSALLPDSLSTDKGTRTGNQQGTLIVPVIGNPNQYYIFSMQDQELLFDYAIYGTNAPYPNFARLFYSVVDMTLDNGKGDIVPGKKGMLLDSLLGSPMIAIPGTKCNIWLMVHDLNLRQFKAYELTAGGISAHPVISNSGYITAPLVDSITDPISWAYSNVMIKISPNNRKLALCGGSNFNPWGVQYNQGLEIHDFDPATGIVSNAVYVDSFSYCYSVCFSPDNSKLYVNTGATIDQYDLLWPTLASMIHAKTTFRNSAIERSDMKLGPDGKIYLNAVNPDSMSKIDFPNLSGTACHFVPNAMKMLHNNVPAPVGDYFTYALVEKVNTMPNEYVAPAIDTVGTGKDTVVGTASVITLKAPRGYQSYIWNDGSTDSVLKAHYTGTYWVAYRSSICTYSVDTFVVRAKLSINAAIAKGDVNMNVYPNPAQNEINVTINGLQAVKGTLVITDATGRTVLQMPCSDAKQVINTSRLVSGIYILQYVDEDSSLKQHMRFVISK